MSSFAERLSWIVTSLCAALGAYGRRIATPPQPIWLGTRCYTPAPEPERLPRLPYALWDLFIRRIRATASRIQRLHDQWRAGTLKPVRARPPRPRTETPPASGPRLPRAFGWANLRARETVPCAGLLHGLLQDEESRRFLAEIPRAARLVRPLCQALGVRQPDWLRLPPRPRTPRTPRPRRDRPTSLTAFDPPLRPYVIAAARASRKRYG
jgi:hypothetical protein